MEEMEQSGVASFFASVVSDEEWKCIPSDITKKIESLIQEKLEKWMTSRALSETARHQAEENLTRIQTECDTLNNENAELKSKLETATSTITELENQLSKMVAETTKLQETFTILEKETSDLRHQRNLAIDECDECQKMLARRNAEVERMQSDITSLTKQLEGAIAAKCEAIANAEEVAALKLTLEYKEKRIDQERALLNSQVETLSEDMKNRTEELLNLRRDNTTRSFKLESKLTEKMQELRLAADSIKLLTDNNNNLIAKIEELNQKLLNEKEVAANSQEAFQLEMDAQKKLADLYHDMSQEKEQLAEKLREGYQEVKSKLDDAIEKYGDLETKYKETLLAHEEILSKKNECITMLKKELEAATLLLENYKQESFQKKIEDLSPSAAVTSKFINSGMSMTQIYTEYVSVSEQLITSKEECAKLQSYITTIIQELEDKSPILAKQRDEYEKAVDTIADLSKHNDDLLNEIQVLREANVEAKKSEGVALRESSRLKKELQDLSRQVCHLLREVEQARAGGSSSTSTDQDISDSTNSADIITKRLVTFSDVSELQLNNQRLLALVRELSSKQEEVEELDLAAVAKLKSKLESMREQQHELLEQQARQSKAMNTLINQRDIYKNLYAQAMKNTGEEVPMQLERPFIRESQSQSPKPQEPEIRNDEKVRELEATIEKLNKEIQACKDDAEIYKKEKAANENILAEQLEKTRSDMQELMRQNTKLTAKIETSEEMFKVLKNNTSIYKNQIEKLEERNKIYSETIVKHETSVKFLRDEVIDAQTKLSRAEILLGNIQKENALLRDSESRLLKERESYKREALSQNLLHTNIELIKATLERNDAESKMRLEEQLQEAYRECAALRRRLQEEQDHFRQLTEHLEKQTKNAQSRMEEEKQQAEKLRLELVELREDIIAKSTQIEDLSKKLKTSLFMGTDASVDAKKYRECEKMLSETQAEVEALQQKLKVAKEAVEQHANVAECAEKQLVEVTEQHKQYTNTTEAKIRELEARVKQLEDQCSELQGELSVYNDGQEITNTDIKRLEKVHLQTSKELQDAKRELEAARNEIKVLQENLETAENKYAREMMLHSSDLQTLTTIKEELAKAVGEIEAAQNERDRANMALEDSKECWAKQEELYQKEKVELDNRFKDLDTQNALLLDQLQELNVQLSLVQAQASDSQHTSTGDISLNKSLTEDEVKSSEQLLKIIKYLRQEKDIAVSKCEILEAEHTRLKSQHDLINKQLAESKASLEEQRQKSDVNVVSAAKHSEVLRKVETLNAITDSNRTLRLERDSLLAQINELRARTTTLEEQVAPLQEKNRELSIKSEAMQTENITLRGEATRWRQRANMLMEKSNRTSPEDWKKLQNERETLAKQLTVERANNTQLTANVNNLTKDKSKLEEQVKEMGKQISVLKEESDKFKEEIASLTTQVSNITNDLQQSRNDHLRLIEDHRVLTEEAAGKDAMINDLKNNLVQIRKIAKKYKTQCEDQTKEIETLKQTIEAKENAEVPEEKQEQFRQEGRSEVEEKMSELTQTNTEKMNELSQQINLTVEENETYKKEIDNLKQTSLEKEERFKTLFKNAKDRIMTLTEQNNSLKAELNNQERQGKSTDIQSDRDKEEIEKLKKEKEEILAEKQAEKEKLSQEIENLTQRVNQLQRQLGQQGSKPSTSSGSTEKSTSEPPTANIKPMSGHSTNTQTQSVPIQPWRSGGEPPLASIRPMSMQLRTVAVLPTSQSPSAVMVPPQQQVHTTGGTSNIEALSSSPTSSHTDYAPATSSAGSTMLGPRQVAVPPTQSSQDAEDEDNNMQVQQAPQQQAVALVLPRVETPNSGPTQEQGTSSSSNTVTTTQAGHKRPREADTESCQSEESKQQQPQKRTRVQQGPSETFQSVSESGLEVEYQVPTSSQRDHEEDTDAVIVVESDEDAEGPDEGEGADDDPDDPDTESYDMEGIPYSEQMNFEDAECQDVEEDEGGNEVEVIEDSSEVPNQSERQEASAQEEGNEQAQSEATSSGADGSSCITVSQASTSVSVTMPSSRTRPVAPLSRQQQTHLLLPEEGGDDGIVPSTPTLFVPRRSDGFGEAVSSPHVPTSGRFTFNESVPPNTASNEVIPEQTLEIANLDENSTGRSVPSTPLQTSPQEANDEQQTHQTIHADGEIPAITVSEVGGEAEQAPEGSSGECMGPPSVAGTSLDTPQPMENVDEMLEGEDGVTSEGEKPPTSEEGEEEGREAEATPSTNTRSRSATTRGSGSVQGRRGTQRQLGHMRGGTPRPSPTPIVWADQRGGNRDQHPRGRGQQNNYSPRVARRSRGRVQRPYGGGNRF